MTGLDYLVRVGADTFCAVCGEWIDMSPDIFGDASKEGRRVDGNLICAACLDAQEEGDEEQ